MKERRKLRGWCFLNKETGVLEPYEQFNGGYGLWATREGLIENVWNGVPRGFKAVRVEISLMVATKE